MKRITRPKHKVQSQSYLSVKVSPTNLVDMLKKNKLEIRSDESADASIPHQIETLYSRMRKNNETNDKMG